MALAGLYQYEHAGINVSVTVYVRVVSVAIVRKDSGEYRARFEADILKDANQTQAIKRIAGGFPYDPEGPYALVQAYNHLAANQFAGFAEV